ncbi:BBE domain-containing protein [Nonomuraea angiospora]|uniref:BBE domain-containing protein n=1 Tax=Nonomuraea angiospora TaxID=46172 RepID=UPI003450A6C6
MNAKSPIPSSAKRETGNAHVVQTPPARCPGDRPAPLPGRARVGRRHHDGTGSYLNLEQADDDRVRWAMGVRRYRRLQQVKAAWDPGDVFRHCAHVSP